MYIPYNLIYNFIVNRCIKLSIDESHAVKHSMDVLKYSQKILDIEKLLNKDKIYNERIIYTSAMIHDMCDSKYMDEKKGIEDIKLFLENINEPKYEQEEINIILKIIGTMSYSKVKKNGFPDIGNYENEYHIVREADLLAGYDVERCIVYGMIGRNFNYKESIIETKKLYNKRMAKQVDDNLFKTKYGLEEANKLDIENKIRLKELYNLLNIKD